MHRLGLFLVTRGEQTHRGTHNNGRSKHRTRKASTRDKATAPVERAQLQHHPPRRLGEPIGWGWVIPSPPCQHTAAPLEQEIQSLRGIRGVPSERSDLEHTVVVGCAVLSARRKCTTVVVRAPKRVLQLLPLPKRVRHGRDAPAAGLTHWLLVLFSIYLVPACSARREHDIAVSTQLPPANRLPSYG